MVDYDEQYSWLQFLPVFPSFLEFVALVVSVTVIIGVGYLIKKHWLKRNDSVPIPVAMVLWLGSFAAYAFVVYRFYEHYKVTDPGNVITIMLWCLVFWVPMAFYYTWTFATSLALRTIDRIDPFSAKIEDPSEFAEARKLAIMGDIAGAVSTYRDYTENQAQALFEAARLLKAENQHLEAVLMFEEIAERFESNMDIWAESTYQLAKIQEISLGEPEAAMENLTHVVSHAPATRYGQLAGAELARLKIMDGDFLDRVAGERELAGLPASGRDSGAYEDDSGDDSDDAFAMADPFYNGPSNNRNKSPETVVKTEKSDKKKVAKKKVAKQEAAKKGTTKKKVVSSKAKSTSAKKPAEKKKPVKPKIAAKRR